MIWFLLVYLTLLVVICVIVLCAASKPNEKKGADMIQDEYDPLDGVPERDTSRFDIRLSEEEYPASRGETAENAVLPADENDASCVGEIFSAENKETPQESSSSEETDGAEAIAEETEGDEVPRENGDGTAFTE